MIINFFTFYGNQLQITTERTRFIKEGSWELINNLITKSIFNPNYDCC